MDIVFEMTKKMISSSNHRQVAEERHRSSRRWLGGCGGNLFVREGIPGITIHLWIGQSTHSGRPPCDERMAGRSGGGGVARPRLDRGRWAASSIDRIEPTLTFMRIGLLDTPAPDRLI